MEFNSYIGGEQGLTESAQLEVSGPQLLQKYQITEETLEVFQDGLNLFQAGEPSTAVERFSRAVEIAPHFAPGHLFLGLGRAMTHEIYPAIDSLELAMKLEPAGFASRYLLAQLYFKLRVPQKGYETAAEALKCVTSIEQRKMLNDLLKEENVRKRNGISRPWFNKPFGKRDACFAAAGMAAAAMAVLLHWRIF